MDFLLFNGKKIFFNTTGQGPALVLLHGFTESQKIWDDFSRQLSHEFQVVTLDLPGHGLSEVVDEVHSMELLADIVHHLLLELGIEQCLMVGHSMGGYAALAFAAAHPEMLKGLCIFHSHGFADSIQDRENRDRTIALVKQDKFGFIVQFIPGLFPPEAQGTFAKEIQALTEEATKMTREGVIAALEGMKIRDDRSSLLQNLTIPVLFIVGMKDSKAPLTRIWEMIALPAISESLLLKDVGHMGYIEKPEVTLQAILHFGLKIFNGK
jgi:pimeloyl-ACP methyl ester carboxylesterase